jgi:hypothetical protein
LEPTNRLVAVGGGGGGGGGGKFRALVEAHATISKPEFVVVVKCTYDGMKDDQAPEEAALAHELIVESLAAVDEAERAQVVDHLQNLLQKVRRAECSADMT